MSDLRNFSMTLEPRPELPFGLGLFWLQPPLLPPLPGSDVKVLSGTGGGLEKEFRGWNLNTHLKHLRSCSGNKKFT